MTDLSPRLLTVAQAARVLGTVSARTLLREIQRGNLRASRIGRCLRITPEHLEEWRLSRPESVTA